MTARNTATMTDATRALAREVNDLLRDALGLESLKWAADADTDGGIVAKHTDTQAEAITYRSALASQLGADRVSVSRDDDGVSWIWVAPASA